ncbi:RNA polymerase sigma factor [Streptoalloteichus hindustanus]|uniref:RNA polymerase sigma-70 factor, ECF subfamily n=1 Tax=Streptoalloteichus hindustanus TaxID=2017 RepID=A0A1M5DGE6_STRHI|nr:RNA polymerase sigma factor [Streptoalloteichus hindustanus]SHF65996.1 RNA polymerase sigma-70 factor, ECF subfamily [Streptoalloteichus hindustanus]
MSSTKGLAGAVAEVADGRPPDDGRPRLSGRDPKVVFAELFDAHAGGLRGYLAGRVGEHLADDLVSETFLIAFRRRDSYDPEREPIRGWLYGIATNVLRNHRRQEIRGFQATARAATLGLPEEPHETRVVARVDAEHRMRQLAGAVAELTDEERDVLFLTSWAGLEPTEVAAALDVPPSTVRSRLHRLRRKLRAGGPAGTTSGGEGHDA